MHSHSECSVYVRSVAPCATRSPAFVCCRISSSTPGDSVRTRKPNLGQCKRKRQIELGIARAERKLQNLNSIPCGFSKSQQCDPTQLDSGYRSPISLSTKKVSGWHLFTVGRKNCHTSRQCWLVGSRLLATLICDIDHPDYIDCGPRFVQSSSSILSDQTAAVTCPSSVTVF